SSSDDGTSNVNIKVNNNLDNDDEVQNTDDNEVANVDDEEKTKTAKMFNHDQMHMMEIEQIKKLMSENKMEEARKMFNELKKKMFNNKNDDTDDENDETEVDEESENKNSEESDEYNENSEYNIFNNNLQLSDLANYDFFNTLINPNDLQEVIKFHMHLQKLLKSKNETSEKKMVKTFLRKTMQKMKDNE
ncbi:conserved protein, unknown function, partial [Hepatocystis sp. ex Piliocolobus tephrosceles]